MKQNSFQSHCPEYLSAKFHMKLIFGMKKIEGQYLFGTHEDTIDKDIKMVWNYNN